MFIYGNKNFKNLVKNIIAFNSAEFISAIKEIEKLKDKYYLAGYISYRAKDVFLGKNVQEKYPILYFGVWKNYEEFNPDTQNGIDLSLFIKQNIDFEKYKNALLKIKEYIKNGTTYEINYTYPNDVYFEGYGYDLFLSLLKNQKTKYSAYIKNEFDEILSFSPELFFEINEDKITTKPMKGTVKRTGYNDYKEIEFLKTDIKNRSENTMIVDLLRNDLSKIKETSDTNVEKLFEVETHKTLHQMTSTISAKINKIDLYDILSSLFPCGSITGAPKISSMKVIDELESYRRNIYCGLIGYIHKRHANFSVPIRILEKHNSDIKYTFAQGGAIVYLSDIEDEFDECKTKRLFLGESIDFDLIETILIKNNTPMLYLEHLKRLQKSAREFGFKFNTNLLNEKFENNKIARIVLKKNGEYEIQYREYVDSKINKIVISQKKVFSKNPFLYYKTTYKPWYQESYQLIKSNKIYDMIFLNEKNELTEGSRTNILLLKNDKLYTPKISSGLLNGIYREKLIKENSVIEKVLYLDDLKNADKIYLVNSVRGIKEVQL